MDLLCFSHLRWNFVYQRPQHLMSRFANHFRVFFIEEPIYEERESYIESAVVTENVRLIVPHINTVISKDSEQAVIGSMLKEIWQLYNIEKYIAWFYTPMAIDLYNGLPPAELVIYDCMDELSLFTNAPASIVQKEKRLLQMADLVFTGGYSLYEAKRKFHPAVYPFPSSIDKHHFEKARQLLSDPPDQSRIPHPRIGFFGVIDERFDGPLLAALASLRPQWHFIVIGPVVKIDPASLPVADNIHYAGSKHYNELPVYLSGWDAAMIPFALNDSTRFISPTKTPEYLAGGRPVVSTPITDIVNAYGHTGLIYIADNAQGFAEQIEKALLIKDNPAWIKAVDNFLSASSWDMTWEKMMFHINTKLESNKMNLNKPEKYV